MDLHLTGKHVVITGGATGIGRAAALEFCREGASVSVCGRTMEKLEKMKQEFSGLGFEADIYQVDVSDFKSVERMADEAAKKHGGIDIWINNAGIAINRPVLDFTKEEYDAVMNIDLAGVFEGCRIAGRHMIAQGRGGVIINAASFASRIPHTEGAVYAAAKSGVSSFYENLRGELCPLRDPGAGIYPRDDPDGDLQGIHLGEPGALYAECGLKAPGRAGGIWQSPSCSWPPTPAAI